MVNLRFKVSEETTVKILQDDFDRSLCEHNCNWNVHKMLNLFEAFYVGGELKIIELQ